METLQLLLIWASLQVAPVQLQPHPLSVPLHLSLSPPSWHHLPLVQSEEGQIFSNSSPFSSTHSLLVLPPTVWAPPPDLQATYGPYSVTQPVSDPAVPWSSGVSASLLSEHVEKKEDEMGQVQYQVRALFHQRGDSSDVGTCVSLHAFRETQEHKASCTTQPPLGLCVVTLRLPGDWFKDRDDDQSDRRTGELRSHVHSYRRVKKKERQQRGLQKEFGHLSSQILRFDEEEEHINGPEGLRFQHPTKNQVQLYYSAVETSNLDLTSGCEEDRWPQTQRQLFFLRSLSLKDDKPEQVSNLTKDQHSCLNGAQEAELNLDPHVSIRYHRGPVLIGQPIRVSVSLRANFSHEFVIIRLQVQKGLVSMVAQRTLSSDLWGVTLEKTQGPDHDVVSILCHRHSTNKYTQDPVSLQQVVCLSVDGLRRSFGVAMSVSAKWWVEYQGHSLPPPHGAGVSTFTFTDRTITGIAPITESSSIINTAILSNQPVSLSVIVLAVSRGGKVSDVTSAVTCQSANEDIIKVSSDCSQVFVDGSESGEGHICAQVVFALGTLGGSVCLKVWAPSVPLRVTLGDPVLNAIDGWDHYSEKSCEPVYQRTSVQVLTQFQALDSQGKTKHFLVSSDLFVDVTELVRGWLRIEDPRVASLGKHNNVIGLQPGKTTLYVVSEKWDGMLGSCDLTVTSDPVTPADLWVQVVSGLGMTLGSSQTHPSVITATVTAYNILYNYHQEASVSVWLQFSDDAATLLSHFSEIPSFLRLSSLAESVIVISPGSRQRIFATGDGGGPLLRTELLVATCRNRPIKSNQLTEDDQEDVEGLRRLARGSGWLRVNLDLDYATPTEGLDEFDFEFSDTLAELDSDAYNEKFEDKIVSARKDYRKKSSNRDMIQRNHLERAVLMPSQEDGMVYFAPSQEKERSDENFDNHFDLEVGLGAVLSLICLFTILFLANCLPCALRDRKKEKEIDIGDCEEMQEASTKEEIQKDGQDLGETGKNDDDAKIEQEHGTIVEFAKEVEIIC